MSKRGFHPVLSPSCVTEDSRSGGGFQVCLDRGCPRLQLASSSPGSRVRRCGKKKVLYPIINGTSHSVTKPAEPSSKSFSLLALNTNILNPGRPTIFNQKRRLFLFPLDIVAWEKDKGKREEKLLIAPFQLCMAFGASQVNCQPPSLTPPLRAYLSLRD